MFSKWDIWDEDGPAMTGTPAFQPPECLGFLAKAGAVKRKNDGLGRSKVDIWAAGVTL